MAKVLAASAFRSGGNADYVRTYHHVTVPHDTTVDDILRPSFWAHHTGALKKNDLLDILSEDGGVDMQARVTDKGTGMVMLRPLRIWVRNEPKHVENKDDAPADDLPENYLVTFAPKQLWRVIIKDPHAIVSTNHLSKDAAIAAAFVHSRLASGVAA
jgi:hypothetical protein